MSMRSQYPRITKLHIMANNRKIPDIEVAPRQAKRIFDRCTQCYPNGAQITECDNCDEPYCEHFHVYVHSEMDPGDPEILAMRANLCFECLLNNEFPDLTNEKLPGIVFTPRGTPDPPPQHWRSWCIDCHRAPPTLYCTLCRDPVYRSCCPQAFCRSCRSEHYLRQRGFTVHPTPEASVLAADVEWPPKIVK